MKHILVILGNGFNLDLGLKTSYKDFWIAKEEILKTRHYKSGYFSKQNTSPPIRLYLTKKTYNNWFDFEESIREYASTTIKREETAEQKTEREKGYEGVYKVANEKFFNLLKTELKKHINSEQKSAKLKENSCAASFLRNIANSNDDIQIFSFNYTDVNYLAKKLGIKKNLNVTYIHGCLKNGNIVFGIGDDSIYKDCGFLLKSEQGVKEQTLINRLPEFDDIIFFGFGFGFNDMHYFKEHFNAIIKDRVKQKIMIYTKDQDTECDILCNMYNMKIDWPSISTKTDALFRYTSCSEDN